LFWYNVTETIIKHVTMTMKYK